jgi:hypothetical protein
MVKGPGAFPFVLFQPESNALRVLRRKVYCRHTMTRGTGIIPYDESGSAFLEEYRPYGNKNYDANGGYGEVFHWDC